MHILVATDADYVLADVTAALDGPDVTFEVFTNGRDVTPAVRRHAPDVAVLDLQVGSMGGMAVTMELRLDESVGITSHVPVLMLLDRRADVHLARRSNADGWLIKPLDALRLERAVATVLAGGRVAEGEPPLPLADELEPVEGSTRLAPAPAG